MKTYWPHFDTAPKVGTSRCDVPARVSAGGTLVKRVRLANSFRRLTLRFRLRSEATARQAATGTAQRASPYLGGVAIRLLLLAALVAAAGAVVLDQKALGRLRSENEALTAKSQEGQHLAAENSTIPQLRQAGEEAGRLRRDVESLPGLRNEVRQLRRQADELKKMRSENERLMSEQKAAQGQAASTSMPADFISRAALGDAGLGTPEAAAQTIFWAMCQGNIDRLTQCSLQIPPGVQSSNGALPDHAGLIDQSLVDHMKTFPGFRIDSRQEVSDTEVTLGLQSSVGGTAMPMTLKRVGLEWKLEHW